MVDKPEILRITDGTTTIDLLSLLNYVRWRPQRLGMKTSQSWGDSPFTIGSYPVFMQYDNVNDLFELIIDGDSQNETIENTQDLGRLLEKAQQYWLTDWQDSPVWIEARASCETEIRYGLIVSYTTPSDDDPYVSPFQDRAIMEGWNLSIIHLPWSENIPGEFECIEISASQYNGFPYNINFLTSGIITIPDSVAIQDLPTATNFTIDGWFYVDNTAAGVNTVAICKNATVPFGWKLEFSNAAGGTATFTANMGTDVITTGTIPLDTWFHFAYVYALGTRSGLMFVNGVPVTSGSQAGVLPYAGDIGQPLYIGSYGPGAVNFYGSIGYVRFSNVALWAPVGFTPPDQCDLPAPDATTIAIWIYEGAGTAIANFQGAAALDGTLLGGEWESACDQVNGQVTPTCNEDVFFSLKHTNTALTHIFNYDASLATYSGNLLFSALPYNLFPSPVFEGDQVYFGIATGALTSGIFDNLVFDITTQMPTVVGIDGSWEYWNGAAWVALTIYNDGTNEFRDLAVHVVTWMPPSNWANTTVNGIDAYWIRFAYPLVPAFPINPNSAQQGNRQVYTVTWPYVDIGDDEVPGDIIAQAFGQIENKHYSGTGLAMSRYIMGLRSLDRGENFTAYINISDHQAWSGFTITPALLNVAWVDDKDAPTGRALEYTSAGAIPFQVFSVSIDNTVLQDFYGKFRVYLTCKQTTGTLVNLAENQLAFYVGIGKTYRYDPVPLVDGSIVEISYLGEISIPRQQELQVTDQLNEFTFLVYCDLAGTYKVNFHELVLMPADEMIIDTHYFDLSVLGCRINAPLDIDSIQYPKKTIRTWLKTGSNYDYPWFNDATGEFFLQANQDQRLWFFGAREGTDNWRRSITTNSLLLKRNARYLSMRGSR